MFPCHGVHARVVVREYTGLNGPQKDMLHILISGTSEGYLIWNKGSFVDVIKLRIFKNFTYWFLKRKGDTSILLFYLFMH